MTELTARDADVFLHQTGSSPVEQTFRAVEGVWAEDHNGHRFMDFQGNTCHNIGYGHPRLVQALKNQLDSLPFTPRGFTNEPAVALAELLSELWPYGRGRVLFGLSGADAIEMAMKLAYVATGRKKTLAFQDSWHGAALGAVWAGGRDNERQGFPRFEGCHHVPPFWARAREESESHAAEAALQAIKGHLEQGDFACFLAEPIRSTPCIPPDWFWPEVRRLCDNSGTLLIFDEIPTGLGKTGRLFASEHFASAPDMTVLGKSLGGGALPLSAVIAREDLNVAQRLAIGHYTHQKNPLLARAGLITLEVILEDGLAARAAELGAAALARLCEICADGVGFRAARGLGLLMAIEAEAPECLPDLRRACFAAGLHVGIANNRFLGLSPPLIISRDDLGRALAIIAAAATGRLPDHISSNRQPLG